MMASIVFETPVFLLETLMLCVLGYWLVDLNQELKYILFFIVVLGIGVMAWQSVVSCCSFTTNHIATVYTLCFVLLGLGTLFGGLLIVRHNMAPFFIPFYYLSVPAVTYRTLLHNDLMCCQMVMTCEDTISLVQKFNAAPPPLMAMAANCTANPSRVVNLGGLALAFLDLFQESETVNVIILILFVFIGRSGAIAAFKLRTYFQYRMKNLSRENPEDFKKAVDGRLRQMSDTR